jgi:hypothetical protein
MEFQSDLFNLADAIAESVKIMTVPTWGSYRFEKGIIDIVGRVPALAVHYYFPHPVTSFGVSKSEMLEGRLIFAFFLLFFCRERCFTRIINI